MNKSLFWKKEKIKNKYKYLLEKYHFDIEFTDNLTANGCTIYFNNKYLIILNKKVPIKLLPLVIFHEIGHIKLKTLNSNPKNYSYFKETTANIYAIIQLSLLFSFFEVIKLLLLAIKNEKELYKYFLKINQLEGDYLYERNIKN